MYPFATDDKDAAASASASSAGSLSLPTIREL